MFTVVHFKYEKTHTSTINRIIGRAENEPGHARAPGSG